jgi:hypothetical protein
MWRKPPAHVYAMFAGANDAELLPPDIGTLLA